MSGTEVLLHSDCPASPGNPALSRCLVSLASPRSLAANSGDQLPCSRWVRDPEQRPPHYCLMYPWMYTTTSKEQVQNGSGVSPLAQGTPARPAISIKYTQTPSPSPLHCYVSGASHHHLSLVYCSVSQLVSLLPTLPPHLSDFISPRSLPHSLHPHAMNPARPPILQAYLHLRAFACAGPTSQNSLSLHTHMAESLSSAAQMPSLWRGLF